MFWPKPARTFGSSGAHRRPACGPGSAGGSACVPRAVWVVRLPSCSPSPCLGLFRLDTSGLSTEDSFTEEFDSITAQKLLAGHGLADTSNTPRS